LYRVLSDTLGIQLLGTLLASRNCRVLPLCFTITTSNQSRRPENMGLV